MMTLNETPANQRKLVLLRTALEAILADVLQHGFHGVATVELRVQDGTIQNVRRKVERIEM
jgi:hypothetical protein